MVVEVNDEWVVVEVREQEHTGALLLLTSVQVCTLTSILYTAACVCSACRPDRALYVARINLNTSRHTYTTHTSSTPQHPTSPPHRNSQAT